MTDRFPLSEQQYTTPAVTFDQYVSYDDDGATVICDRSNAAAWIRSTALWPCER